TDDLGLDKAGIATDSHGYIQVDDQLRTSVPGIWAMGDCNGRGAFTHTSWNDFEIVAANILDNEQRRVSDRISAYALYTDPPLGRAGMTEAEVRNTGKPALISTMAMEDVSRAYEKGETAHSSNSFRISPDHDAGIQAFAVIAFRHNRRSFFWISGAK